MRVSPIFQFLLHMLCSRSRGFSPNVKRTVFLVLNIKRHRLPNALRTCNIESNPHFTPANNVRSSANIGDPIYTLLILNPALVFFNSVIRSLTNTKKIKHHPAEFLNVMCIFENACPQYKHILLYHDTNYKSTSTLSQLYQCWNTTCITCHLSTFYQMLSQRQHSRHKFYHNLQGVNSFLEILFIAQL